MSAIIANTTSARLTWLDELRGIASLSVVVYHLVLAKQDVLSARYFDLGVLGVSVFFLISGFVVPFSLKEESWKGIKLFVISRFFRLYPVYWASLILSIAAYGAYPAQIVASVTMFQEFLGFKNINGVYWTLTVELIYYICLVFFAWFGLMLKPKAHYVASVFFAFLALSLGLTRYYLDIKAPMAPIVGLSLMFLASFSRMYCWPLRGSAFNNRFTLAALVVLLFAILSLSFKFGYSKNWGYNETPLQFVITDAAALLIFFTCASIGRLTRIFAYFGKISYSMYLVHVPVAVLFSRFISGQVSVFGYLCLEFATVLILSHVLYLTCEKPGMEIGRWVRQRVTPVNAA